MALSKEEKRKYLEILGLPPGATYVEVKRAYKRLMKMYTSETSVLTPIAIEFSRRKKQEIMNQLEEAYIKISAQIEYEQSLMDKKKKTPERVEIPAETPQKDVVFSGRLLQDIRKKLGVQLFDVALETKIRKEILQNIENENFESLPPEVYLRGHVWSYARYLSLNPKKVAEDYMNLYRTWKERQQK
ncbi:MAG: helix-turn-helix domain-containing protein [Candidatus Aminicenantes bacterium]|jgi:curved DNA-binding protein CbpA